MFTKTTKKLPIFLGLVFCCLLLVASVITPVPKAAALVDPTTCAGIIGGLVGSDMTAVEKTEIATKEEAQTTDASGTAATPGASTTPATSTSTSIGVPIPTTDSNGSLINGPSSYSSWGAYLSDIYKFAQYVGVFLAILMIVYAAVIYITSQGDTGKIGTAKEYLIGALVGLALLFLINYLARVMNISGIN
jgi:hypothetical protein